MVSKDEIFRYINLGRSSSISIDRHLMEKYPGIIRNITIRRDEEVQIDFHDKHILEINEGEVTFYFQYENYDILFDELEKFLGLKMDEWQNYNKTDWYPETDDIDLKESWGRLTIDFINKALPFPSNFISFRIASIYWEGLDWYEYWLDGGEDWWRDFSV